MRTGKKRRRKLRPIFKILFFLIIVAFVFLGSKEITKRYEFSDSFPFVQKKLNVKTVEMPDFVDVDLIDIGNARKGIKLREINYIVIHYTGNPGTTAKNNRDYFAKTDTEVCSHFVIGLDGEIIQCVPIDERSAASNQQNKDSISIEVCHEDEDGRFNEKTYNSLVKLTAWLMDNSSLETDGVIRHYDVTGKLCPKYYVENEYEWQKLKKDIFNSRYLYLSN